MAKQETLHSGHRQRLKNRFLENGLDSFEPHQVLELLLYYCIPRQDTNPLAHALLDHFSSLKQILEASPAELKKVPGMGDSAATFISLLNAFYRYYDLDRDEDVTILSTPKACINYLSRYFRGRRNETVYMLCLDAKYKLLYCKELGEGSVNSAAVPIRKIVETALGINASAVVLAHNHPSGLAIPSQDDQLTTKQLAYALSAVDIVLMDHIIFADKASVSMQDVGLYTPDECRIII